MRARIFASLLLCSLLLAVGGDAQSPDITEKPVWTLEFIKVRPEKFGLTLGYLDDNWMRLRQEAKREGAVLSYHRFVEGLLKTHGSKPGPQNSIVLLTEYKNPAAFFGRDKLFASILEHLPKSTPGVLPSTKPEEGTSFNFAQPEAAHYEGATDSCGFGRCWIRATSDLAYVQIFKYTVTLHLFRNGSPEATILNGAR